MATRCQAQSRSMLVPLVVGCRHFQEFEVKFTFQSRATGDHDAGLAEDDRGTLPLFLDFAPYPISNVLIIPSSKVDTCLCYHTKGENKNSRRNST